MSVLTGCVKDADLIGSKISPNGFPATIERSYRQITVSCNDEENVEFSLTAIYT